MPAIFELAAELAYPKSSTPEAIRGSMIVFETVFLWNIASVVTIFTAETPEGIPQHPIGVNFITAGHFLLAALLARNFFKVAYGRSDAGGIARVDG